MSQYDCLLIGFRSESLNPLYQEFADDTLLGLKVQKQFNGAIAYLGTFLHRRGYTFDYVNYLEDDYEQLKMKLEVNQYTAIGISTTYIMELNTLTTLTKTVRALKPEAVIILGGPYVINLIRGNTHEPAVKEKMLRLIDADFIENDYHGALTLCRIIDALKKKDDYSSIPNLCYRANRKFYYTELQREDFDLEDNTVDWRLFQNQTHNALSVRTSRSCPYRCKFCNFPVMEGQYRCITVQAIEKELTSILMLSDSVKCVNFVDDTFNMPKERFKEILKMMIKNHYPFYWYSYIRCQFLDEEIVRLMKESKCIGVYLGIESGCQRMLDNMNKRAKISDFYKGIRLFNEQQIITYGTFFVGFPGETSDSVNKTIDFLNHSGLTLYDVSVWRYDINTPITLEKERYALEGAEYNWKHSTMDTKRAKEMQERIVRSVSTSVYAQFDPTMLFLFLSAGATIQQFLEFYHSKISQKNADRLSSPVLTQLDSDER